MSRYLSWLANGALLVLCCFLVANTANAVIAAWLAPAPDEFDSVVAAAPPADRSWSQRQLILDRNLFGAKLQSQDTAPPPPDPDEELEATTLPLSLIGTVASSTPRDSWAAVEDRESREHMVLQQGDSVKGKATVERIEPKRIVLRENGQLRELALSDETPVAVAAPTRGRAGRNTRTAARRSPRRAPRAPQPPPPQMTAPENPLATAAQLFSQANIVPKFESGEMVGMQVEAVEPGTAIEAAGIEAGDVITELNGIRIDSQEQGQRALAELAGSDGIDVKVRGADGSEREIPLSLNATE